MQNYPITYNRNIGYLSSTMLNRSSSSLRRSDSIDQQQQFQPPATPSSIASQKKRMTPATPPPITGSTYYFDEQKFLGMYRPSGKTCCLFLPIQTGVILMILSWLAITVTAVLKVYPIVPQPPTASSSTAQQEEVMKRYTWDAPTILLFYFAIYGIFKFWTHLAGLIIIISKRMIPLRIFTGYITLWDTLITLGNTILYTWFIYHYERLPNPWHIGTCALDHEQCWSPARSQLEPEMALPAYRSEVKTLTLVMAWMLVAYQLFTAYTMLDYYRGVQRGLVVKGMPRRASVTLFPKGAVQVKMPRRMNRAYSIA